jgi:hypothetical protein
MTGTIDERVETEKPAAIDSRVTQEEHEYTPEVFLRWTANAYGANAPPVRDRVSGYGAFDMPQAYSMTPEQIADALAKMDRGI